MLVLTRHLGEKFGSCLKQMLEVEKKAPTVEALLTTNKCCKVLTKPYISNVYCIHWSRYSSCVTYFISKTSSKCLLLSALRVVRWASFSARDCWVDDILAFMDSSSCFTFSIAPSSSSICLTDREMKSWQTAHCTVTVINISQTKHWIQVNSGWWLKALILSAYWFTRSNVTRFWKRLNPKKK